MKTNKLFYLFLFIISLQAATSCKKQLDVGNPNAPTLEANANNETGIIGLAKGGVYINGFQNGDGWLGNSFFSLPFGYIELLGDNLGAEASNNQVTTVGVPDYVILDDGSKLVNTSPSVGIFRAYNTRAATGAGNNPVYYHWLNMYAMNNSCNTVLSRVSNIPFSGDTASRANTIRAWCYWWKGYAYAVIGTTYYSGLINDAFGTTNNAYVLHDAIIAESNKNFNLAATALNAITTTDDYTAVLTQLIPEFTQVGKGGVLSKDMWLRNINTMLARNILLNKLAPFINGNLTATIAKSSTTAMTAEDWNTVLSLATNGVQAGDFVFTGRSAASNGFFTAASGTAAAETTGPNTSNTFKISERFIQNFKTGDKRIANNFYDTLTFKNDYTFATRYSLQSGGYGLSGVYVYGNTDVGGYEQYIAGSYEENALMLAEANIRLGNTEAGLAYVDAVRNYQGAGVAAVAGTGLSQAGAMKEVTMERKTALIFRGIAFYDNRRWGWTYDISNGGGSYGNHIYNSTTKHLYTNATIDYNFIDYWDIPADETVLNPPGDGSAAVVNPNF